MKYLKIGLVLCVLFALFPLRTEAQDTMKITVSATVKGAEGELIEGASVTSDDNAVNEVTDETGIFSAEVTVGSELTVAAVGHETKRVVATSELTEIRLSVADELVKVNVAYREVEKRDLLGGVSVVDVPEVMKENYITYGLEGLEALTNGFSQNIWGMDEYLVLVDGVPRDPGNVNTSEIEQITLLKGVSAVALYGSRAAKGVIQITTKRGQAGDQQIDVRVNHGIHIPKSYPKYLGSAEYMTLYNEARINDGLSEAYTEEEIYHHSSGENPYRYPSVDYYSSDYLKEVYHRTDVTAEVQGGGERAQYYSNFGFVSNGSLLDFGEAVDNNSSNRFNMRGNIDVKLNDFITAYVDGGAIFYTGKGVNADFWGSSATTRPHRFSPFIPIDMIEENDGSSMTYVNNSNYIIDGRYLLGGTQLDQTNAIADIYAGGTNTFNSREFQFKTGVNADLNNVIEGLTFESMFAVDYSSSYSLAYNNEYATYEPTWTNYSGKDLIASLQKYGNDSKTGEQSVSGSWYERVLAFSGQFNYRRTFNDVHNVTGMLVAGGHQLSETGSYHRTSNANIGILASYNYNHRYYVDFSGAVAHSAKLPKDNRQAFSPTVSLGWRLSEEPFMEGVSAVDNLKLTASAGIIHTDLDIDDYYLYQGYYTYNNGAWISWRDGALVHTYDRRRGSNPNLSFPKRKELNLGLEASLFDRMITLDGSFFINRMSDKVVQASVLYPSYFSTGWPEYSNIPYTNYEEDERVGFDFKLNMNKRLGEVDMQLGVSGLYYDTKAITRSELNEYEYQNRAGRPLDGLWGLENDGFFMSEEDIANSASQTFGEVKPGDIKYKDQNGDGVIDNKDEVFLAKGGWSGAPFTMGIHLSAKWKNFTFYALGTGRFKGYAMKNNSYHWVDGDDKYSEVVRDRWTEETKNSASYPRLTTRNSDNNFRSSDFWMYNTDRFDLSKVQLTYSIPQSFMNKMFIDKMDVYVNGNSLLTISPERETMEMNVGQAPQTRFVNLGVKAVF